MENVRGAAQAISFSEARHCTVVQQLDPLDRLVNAIAVTNGEERKAFVFFVARWYPLLCLLLESLQFLVEVSNGTCILILFLVVDPVPLSDSLYE